MVLLSKLYLILNYLLILYLFKSLSAIVTIESPSYKWKIDIYFLLSNFNLSEVIITPSKVFKLNLKY